MNLQELIDIIDKTIKHNPRIDLENVQVVITTAPDGTVGGRARAKVKYAGLGFDWERNQFRLEPEETLHKFTKSP